MSDGDLEDYELPTGRETSGRGLLGSAVASLLAGAAFSFSINGLDYVKLGAGGFAVLLAMVAGVSSLRKRRFKTGALAGLVAAGGALMVLFSGALQLSSLSGLFGPSLEEVAATIASREELTDVEVTDEGGGRFSFRGRRQFEHCSGEYRGSSNTSSTFMQCGLPEDLAGLESVCEEGSVVACNLATERLHDGEPVDWPRLNQLTEGACARGSRVACFYAGVSYEHGRGREIDLPAGLRAYRRGCELRDSSSCINAGVFLSNGRGTETDAAGAVALWQRACDMEDVEACERVGEAYRDGDGVERDIARASTLFQSACDAENGIACTNIASLALRGEDRPEADPAFAFMAYERACQFGSRVGCRMAGRLLRDGRGVDAEPGQAIGRFTQACEADDPLGCLDAGMMLHQGADDVPENPASALAQFERGCTLDNMDCCNNSAVYLRDGLAGTEDTERAAVLFRRACALGHSGACREAG
ncbi:MAG: hypothetical protein AB8I08_15545 [Sandaracinaceae bacterium]